MQRLAIQRRTEAWRSNFEYSGRYRLFQQLEALLQKPGHPADPWLVDP